MRASNTVLARSLPTRKASVGTPFMGEKKAISDKISSPVDWENRANKIPVTSAVAIRPTMDSAVTTALAAGLTGYIAP